VSHALRLFVVLLLLCVCLSRVRAQPDTTRRVDTLGLPPDTTARSSDTVRTTMHRSQVDTTILYSARDSIRSDIRRKIIRLWGDAVVVNGDMRLEAAYIEIDYGQNLLLARSRYDSTLRRHVGVPLFRDAQQEVSAEELAYNFKTRQASLKAAESKLEDAFYYGAAIRKVDDNTFFIKDGVYTTCDEPHPHYWFSSTEMRVEAGDKVFADHLALNIAGVPVFYMPIGVYFPLDRKGKMSGIILPQLPPQVSGQLGVIIEPIGFFWAGNDYIDALATLSIYGKGGGTLTLKPRFRHNALHISSDLTFTGGLTRDTPDDPYHTNIRVQYGHSQAISRVTRIDGNIDYTTQNFLRNTNQRINDITRVQDVTTQLVSSNISFNTQVLGTSISVGYGRDQNIITDRLNASIPFGITLPTITPFASSDGGNRVFPDNISFGLSMSGQQQFNRSDTLADGSRLRDKPFGASINPSLSIPIPTGDLFSLSIGPTFRAGLFYRSVRKEFVDSVLTTAEETRRPVTNPFLTYNWGVNATLSTKFYGLVQPRVLGVNAIRHTVIPTVTFNYSPDNGTRYRDSVIDPRTGKFYTYTIFDPDAGLGYVPAQGENLGATLALSNIFEAKIAQEDTLPDRKVTLLNLGISTSYNARAYNGVEWSPITVTASTELGTIGSISGNATFDLYRRNDSTGLLTPTFLGWSGGLVHPTSASISFNTGFSDAGFTAGVPITAVADSAAARRARFDFAPVPFNEGEFFGENVRGISDFRIPWQLDLSVTYSLSERYLISQRGIADSLFIDKTLSVIPSVSFSLTPTTTIRGSVAWNPLARDDFSKLTIPALTLTKDLHCWELSFTWQPTGISRYYGFRIGLKAPQLQDIKIEQQRSSYEPP